MSHTGDGRRAGKDEKAGVASRRPGSPAGCEAGNVEGALALALQFVVARQRTAHEVRQKLVRSGVSEAVIESVLEQLQERRLLDDAAYTRAYLTSRLSHRGYGPQRLSRELHQRGVGRALIEEAVQHTLEADDVLAAARAQALKRWPRLGREPDPARRRQKLYDFLRRRGFASAIVQRVLADMLAEHPSD
ncbi:MAG: regulatory protein RecX [Candidatus Tectimicrobiota bacterium]